MDAGTAQSMIDDVSRWAALHDDIVGLAMVGSHARGAARADSDIDFVVVCADPGRYLGNTDWLSTFGEVTSLSREDWGKVQSLRVSYRGRPEVELGIAGLDWTLTPPDDGTAVVLRAGCVILLDRKGLLGRVLQSARGSAEGKVLTLGLLASHRGSNVRAVVEACRDGRLEARPGVVISNNASSGVLEFASVAGIPARRIGGPAFADDALRDAAILEELRRHEVDLVLLLGYMKLLGPRTTDAFRGRIVNTHPALLPRHGGKGMYGARVHEAVLAAGDTETGVTVHLVDEEYDHGEILAQCRVPVEPGDTVESLSARVLEREHAFLVQTLQAIAKRQIVLAALAGSTRSRALRGPSSS